MKIATSTSRAWLLCLLVSSAVLRNAVVVGYQDSDLSAQDENDDEDDDEDEDDEDDEEDEYYDPAQEDPLDACRRNPTWKSSKDTASGNSNSNISSFYKKCQELTGWQPRDELNRSNDYLSAETKQSMGRCVDDKFHQAAATAAAAASAAASSAAADDDEEDEDEQQVVFIEHAWTLCNESDRTNVCQVPATELHGFYTHKRDGDIITMSDALTEQEVFGIQALVDCMHDILPKDVHFFEERTFGVEPTDENGNLLYHGSNSTNDDDEDTKETGNVVTYMHGLLQLYLPGVASTVYRLLMESYEKSHWAERFDLPHPSTLGLRTAEFIQYEHTAYLGHHEDSNSVYTISIALSHPHEYQGGMFHLWSGEAMFKVPRRSAIAFLAETQHAITQVTGGQRNVLVVELWRRPDSPLGMTRPIPATFDEYVKNHTAAAAAASAAALAVETE